MGSKRDSSSGLDWEDLAIMMEGFESLNRVKLTLHGEFCLTGGLSDMRWEVKAVEVDRDDGVVPLLGSASATCRQGRYKTLAGLLSYLLYQMDFRLAEHEWERIKELPM